MHVNGKTALLGQKADPEVDEITVDGRPLTQEGQKRYLMLNKPRGYVCTLSDEKGLFWSIWPMICPMSASTASM